MMTVISQIILCLILAAIIGFIVGWLLAKLLSRGNIEDMNAEWEEELREQEQNASAAQLAAAKETSSYKARLGDLEMGLDTSTKAYAAISAELDAVRRRLAAKETDHAILVGRLAELDALKDQIKARDARITEVEEKHSAALRSRDDDAASLQERIRDLEPLIGQLQLREAELKDFQARMTSVISDKDADTNRLKQRLAELEAVRTQVSERDSAIRDWETRYNTLTAEKNEALSKLQWRIGELEPLQGEVAHQQARIAELGARIAELERLPDRVSEQDRLLAEWNTRHVSVVRDKDNEIARLVERIRELESVPRRHAWPPSDKDDLKAIYGVGPVLERMLNNLGVYYFRDVARWTDEDIDRVDSELLQFHGRIRGEGWVASAKEEHFKKYNERI